MRISLSLLFILCWYTSGAQNDADVEAIDKFKINHLRVDVFFKDPLKQLIRTYPDFDSKENQLKHNLLDQYLHNNTLYIFKTTSKEGIVKTYELKGSPLKIKTRNFYIVDIKKQDGSLEKSVDKTGIGGSFFEHMLFFQSSQGKQAVGKGIQIWGYFVMVEPFKPIKAKMTALIEKDTDNAIPEDMLVKEQIAIEPLFRYQQYALNTVSKRILTTTVYQYDESGNITNKYPRIETDTTLYLSSTSNDIGGVTSLPFFSARDQKITTGDTIRVISTLKNINYYLEDIKVTLLPKSNEIDKIESTLLIHGYSAKGESIHRELYVAEFDKVGTSRLPKTIKFCSLTDTTYSQPRIVTTIEYELK